jgi:metal-sulfur cluster biosynthetic enzyme
MNGMATEAEIREALRQILDPEIGVNIVDLGLVYRIETEAARARIVMTMTSPACPLADFIRDQVMTAVLEQVPGVTDVDVVVEWEPPWDPDMMSDEGRRQMDEGPR